VSLESSEVDSVSVTRLASSWRDSSKLVRGEEASSLSESVPFTSFYRFDSVPCSAVS
jgi:hypothetical protein